jgi:hypothetical protein
MRERLTEVNTTLVIFGAKIYSFAGVLISGRKIATIMQD